MDDLPSLLLKTIGDDKIAMIFAILFLISGYINFSLFKENKKLHDKIEEGLTKYSDKLETLVDFLKTDWKKR